MAIASANSSRYWWNAGASEQSQCWPRRSLWNLRHSNHHSLA